MGLFSLPNSNSIHILKLKTKLAIVYHLDLALHIYTFYFALLSMYQVTSQKYTPQHTHTFFYELGQNKTNNSSWESLPSYIF